MRFEVEFDGFIVIRDGESHSDRVPSEDELHDFLEQVMVALEEHGAEDPTISGTAQKNALQISIVVEAAEPVEALDKGSATIRAGVHAVGAFTPGWTVDWCEVTARLSEGRATDRPELVGA